MYFLEVFGRLLITFYCMTIKLILQAYRRYFQVYWNHASKWSYFGALFDIEKGPNRSNAESWPFSQKCSTVWPFTGIVGVLSGVYESWPGGHIYGMKNAKLDQNSGFGHFCCVSMKLVLHACRRYFQEVCKSWPPGVILLGPFWPWKLPK